MTYHDTIFYIFAAYDIFKLVQKLYLAEPLPESHLRLT